MNRAIGGLGSIRGILASRARSQAAHKFGNRNARAPHSTSFGETLQFITSIKLEELEKQRLAFKAHAAVIDKAAAVSDDPPRRVELLLDAVRSWRGSGAADPSTVIAGKLELSSIDLWLLQARKDPGFSPDVVKDWAETLETHVRHSMTRFEFAKLFGGLFNEWLSSGDSVARAASPKSSSDEVVEAGRKEMYEQEERLKSIIFEPKAIDADGLGTYLAELFSGSDALEALKRMRRGMKKFADDLQGRAITEDDIQWVIKSLLASNLMQEMKRDTLREFTQNPTVLEELATVLTMRLANLENWSWPAHGTPVDMRRHLNGKYRAHTDPSILDAMLLEYIGVSFQVKLKDEIQQIFSSKAWKQEYSPLSRDHNEYFKEFASNSIHSHRQTSRKQRFLAGQLASEVDSVSSYDDGDNADNTTLYASHVKQELLHTATTECYLNTTIYGTHAVVYADFEWFGPSLPFDTILGCLAFFGVPKPWLDFFQTFLRVPLTFNDDKPGDAPRVRQRGTPTSFALSSFFGESVLFALDFAVNQRAGGLFLHRIHDDLWLWDAKSDKCVAAWKEMKKFAALTGLTFNEAKTGAASVGVETSAELPSGEIRWGFLRFDPTQARFVIDQQEVDKHIAELRRQLAAAKSVFGWINAYNKYIAFFSRNFGARPTVSLCLGRPHIDDMIDTFARIQRELFPSASGVVGHLRSVIGDRFGVRDLPDGYFYLPMASGGMELHNPLIDLLAVRDALKPDPAFEFSKQMEKDKQTYHTRKARWNSDAYSPARGTTFPSYETFISHRETGLQEWKDLYCVLMSAAVPTPMYTPTLDMNTPIYNMSVYDRWVMSVYGHEVIKKFGSLKIVDPTLIPVGLVDLFRRSRHQWDQ